jgi:hypothetical protein
LQQWRSSRQSGQSLSRWVSRKGGVCTRQRRERTRRETTVVRVESDLMGRHQKTGAPTGGSAPVGRRVATVVARGAAERPQHTINCLAPGSASNKKRPRLPEQPNRLSRTPNRRAHANGTRLSGPTVARVPRATRSPIIQSIVAARVPPRQKNRSGVTRRGTARMQIQRFSHRARS